MGIAGLGGYAATVRRELLEQARQPGWPVRLVAVCEPNPSVHAQVLAELQSAGVRVSRALRGMLRARLDAVWLPVPIDLHRSMTEESLAAGKSVLCEQPPAGCVDDLDAMVAAQRRSTLPCAVGYQDICHPATVLLKKRILDEAIGSVLSASVVGCWPRDERYFARNAWAGRIRHNGVWILDSPANNALAHFINLALFLLGPELYAWAIPTAVEAELYRAAPIENYDTASMRIWLSGKRALLVLVTHACMQRIGPIIEITGQRGAVRVFAGDCAEVHLSRGVERLSYEHSRIHLIERFARLVCNQPDERAVPTLEGSRAHLAAINGASEACPIRTVADRFVERIRDESGAILHAIIGIEEAFVKCSREGRMLHESGRAAWSAAPARCELQDYRHFKGPAA